MADEETIVLESKASPEDQAAAAKIGWVGPENYRGEPERFVDADEYIKRGETVLPIVKKQLATTRAELEQVRADSAATKAALAQAQRAIEEIEIRHSVDTQKAVEAARKEVKAQLARASEAGDHEAVAELTDQLTQLKEVEGEEKPKPKAAAEEEPKIVISPVLRQWNTENPWFGTDKKKTGLAQGIAQEIAEENAAEGTKMSEKDFYAEVSARMEAFLPKEEPATREDKVGGANHRAGARSSAAKNSYESMPADAKAQCDADARKFVGPDKLHKDIKSWRSSFADLYFKE